jgi:hypothetical protein
MDWSVFQDLEGKYKVVWMGRRLNCTSQDTEGMEDITVATGNTAETEVTVVMEEDITGETMRMAVVVEEDVENVEDMAGTGGMTMETAVVMEEDVGLTLGGAEEGEVIPDLTLHVRFNRCCVRG